MPDSLGENVADSDTFADSAREVQTFNGSAQVSTVITAMTTIATTASRARSGVSTLTADVVDVGQTRTYTNLATGGTRSQTTDKSYDSLGRLVRQTDGGIECRAGLHDDEVRRQHDVLDPEQGQRGDHLGPDLPV